MPRRLVFLSGLIAALAACGCGTSREDKKGDKPAAGSGDTKAGADAPAQSPADLDAPLAKIDQTVITVREFQDRINRQSPYIRARYTSHEQKKEFLDSLVRFEVLALEAHARGFDKDPDVVRTMKQVMIQKLMKEQFDEKLGPESITEAEMKKYFDEHLSEFNKPEEVRVSAIVLKTKKQADEVAKAAQTEAGKTNKGFRDLVTKNSVDDESKLRGGDLRYFAADTKEVPKPVVDASFALTNTGDTSAAVDGGNGSFYVVKQTGRRKAITKTFDQVKRQIQNRLYRDKRTDSQKTFIEGLRKKAKIETFDDNLDKVQVDQSTEVTGDPRSHGGMGTGVDDIEPAQEAEMPGGNPHGAN